MEFLLLGPEPATAGGSRAIPSLFDSKVVTNQTRKQPVVFWLLSATKWHQSCQPVDKRLNRGGSAYTSACDRTMK
jgi:hypothetical protein